VKVHAADIVAVLIERLCADHAVELPLLDDDHAIRCATFAAELFDALAPTLQLEASDQRLAIAAALWHDVGYARDARDHGRKSYDMIAATPMPEFEASERQIIACVARYHRRLLPNIEHAGFGQMTANDQRRVRRLSAIVRIAVALDAGHLGVIVSVAATQTLPEVHLVAVAKADAEVERDRLLENGAAFRQLTQLPFTFEIVVSRRSRE
jgi:exopolyphosphatase/guanosine-5'-triphosphate,3'-diphosphate pyrophosphatase